MQNTFDHEADFRQERDFGQKISATFEFIRAHFRPLGRVMLTLVVPAALLRSIVEVLGASRLTGVAQEAMQTSSGVWGMQRQMYGAYLSQPLYWFSISLNTAFFTLLVLTVYGYLRCCLERPAALPSLPAAEITPTQVWAVIKQQFISTFFSIWAVAIMTAVAMLVLFIPGIYLSVVLSLFFVIKVMEGTSFSSTLSRCSFLIKGKWWSTFGLLMVMVMLLYMLLVALSLVSVALSGGLQGLLHIATRESPILIVAITALNSLIQLLVYPVMLLVLAFQYFNLVERRDGLGMSKLVAQIGQLPATATVRNEAYRADEEGEY